MLFKLVIHAIGYRLRISEEEAFKLGLTAPKEPAPSSQARRNKAIRSHASVVEPLNIGSGKDLNPSGSPFRKGS